MSLREYFQTAKGLGVLATADAEGRANAAVYGRPHFIVDGNDERLAFVMGDHRSHANLQSNPHAAYLFIEEGEGYQGRRIELKKVDETDDPKKVGEIQLRCSAAGCEDGAHRFLVLFAVTGVRPLIGDEFEEKKPACGCSSCG